jgi:hypothetical protein
MIFAFGAQIDRSPTGIVANFGMPRGEPSAA